MYGLDEFNLQNLRKYEDFYVMSLDCVLSVASLICI